MSIHPCIPALIGRVLQYIHARTAPHFITGLTYKDKHPPTHKFTPTDNLETLINLFQLWEEACQPWGNPHSHKEKLHTVKPWHGPQSNLKGFKWELNQYPSSCKVIRRALAVNTLFFIFLHWRCFHAKGQGLTPKSSSFNNTSEYNTNMNCSEARFIAVHACKGTVRR